MKDHDEPDEIVMRKMYMGYGELVTGYGVFFVNSLASIHDYTNCLGVVFNDRSLIETEPPERQWALWVKRISLSGELIWAAQPMRHGSEADVPEMTQTLYVWAMLGGYKEKI